MRERLFLFFCFFFGGGGGYLCRRLRVRALVGLSTLRVPLTNQVSIGYQQILRELWLFSGGGEGVGGGATSSGLASYPTVAGSCIATNSLYVEETPRLDNSDSLVTQFFINFPNFTTGSLRSYPLIIIIFHGQNYLPGTKPIPRVH